jgi:transcriptional regulator with XRE-family HTH domain
LGKKKSKPETGNPLRQEQKPIDEGQSQSTPDPQRLAIGALLGFYRRIKRMSQVAIAEAAGLKASSLGMFEAAQRLPGPQAIDHLATALDLDGFQRQQLQLIGTYSSGRGPTIGEPWIIPEDVLHGTPVFLRDVHREADAQRKASISEMWIVTNRPLALGGELYELLKRRLLVEKTSYVYFIDSATGELPFKDLWSRLLSDTPLLRKILPEKLKCVLVPATLCVCHYGICNPGKLETFGRHIIYASGIPVGFLSMDSEQVSRAYRLLAPIYQRIQKERKLITEYGTFQQIRPDLGDL